MLLNLFPSVIYKVKYLENLEPLVDELEKLFADKLSTENITVYDYMRGDSYGASTSGYNLQSNPAFKDFIEFCEHHAKIYWDHLGYDPVRVPKLRLLWANLYKPGSYIDVHDHSPMPLSFAFYVKKSPQASNIFFINPIEGLLKYQPFANLRDRDEYYNFGAYEVSVAEGDVVFFPGYLKHKTKPTDDLNERITLSGNLQDDYRLRLRKQ